MAGECPGWYCLFLAASKSGDATGLRVGAGLVTSNSVTITPVGGVAPYSYAWAYVSGSASPAVSSATAQTVTWSASSSPVATVNAVWRCTVSDSGGSTPVTVDVNVELTWEV